MMRSAISPRLATSTLRNETQGLCHKASVFDLSVDIGFPDCIAEAILGVGIPMVIDFRAVDIVGFAIDADGQVTSSTGETELTLTARRFDSLILQFDRDDLRTAGVFRCRCLFGCSLL